MKFDFEMDRTGKTTVQILDVLGNVVVEEHKEFHKGIIHSDIQIKHLPEGVYYLKIDSDELNGKAKFMKYRK